MKRSLLTLAILMLAMAAQAQFKMHDNGRITFQTLVNSTDYGITMDPAPTWKTNFNGAVHFKQGVAFRKPISDAGWMNCAITSASNAMIWVVSSDWYTASFYVKGNGTVISSGNRTISRLDDAGSKGIDTEPINGDEALSIVSELNGYYVPSIEHEIPDLENNEFVDPEAVEAMHADLAKRTAELSAAELSNIFPDAVRTDPRNRLCIDYQSVVTMLVEAVKEQQREIEELRNVLERVEKNK